MMRLPWHGKTVPHAVVDILRGCNCRCADCYNSAQPSAKPLDDIKADVRAIRSARNVRTISLSGGEPLLHPQIVDIVSYLRRDEHVAASMLTNGILFDGTMAEKLRAAGLDFVTFHIQRGQTRPDCDDTRVEAVRREKGRIARAHGIYPAVVETIRSDDVEGFAALGRFLRAAPEFEYALVTVARNFAAIDPAVADPEPDRKPMLAAFAREGYGPSVFVGALVCPPERSGGGFGRTRTCVEHGAPRTRREDVPLRLRRPLSSFGPLDEIDFGEGEGEASHQWAFGRAPFNARFRASGHFRRMDGTREAHHRAVSAALAWRRTR